MKEKEDLLQKLEKLRRKAWKPVVREAGEKLTASKFSGTPYLSGEEEWPPCGNCGRPMQLFVQLNMRELPGELSGMPETGDGLLQMFYCTSQNPTCESECEAYDPFSRSTLLRIVKVSGENVDSDTSEGRLPLEGARSERYSPVRTITGWEEMDDYPMCAEIKSQGVFLSKEEEKLFRSMDFPAQGDKLGGWPYWVQDVEYPECPLCGEKMRFIFQIDSQDNLPYEFGDSGCGHIFQCSEHKETVAFGWECC